MEELKNSAILAHLSQFYTERIKSNSEGCDGLLTLMSNQSRQHVLD